jgi:hypothetical protein
MACLLRTVSPEVSLAPGWKFHGDRPPKYLLRRAFAADLSKDVVDSPKQKFSMVAGSSNRIAQIAECEITDMDFQTKKGRLLARQECELSNKEALYYYRILPQNLEDRWIFQTMGRSRIL